MSGEGVPGATGAALPDGRGLRIGVVAARWHAEIADALLVGAQRGLAECGVTELVEVRVPGAFELPVAAKVLAGQGCEAVVCLGVVIRGGTPHFDYVCRAATDGLTRVALDSGVPVGFGVLTCDTEGQARDRAGLPGSGEDKGYDAALAAVDTAVSLREIHLDDGSGQVKRRER
jgi:6,7-dimethyl-8-ribityllumazine synthase